MHRWWYKQRAAAACVAGGACAKRVVLTVGSGDGPPVCKLPGSCKVMRGVDGRLGVEGWAVGVDVSLAAFPQVPVDPKASQPLPEVCVCVCDVGVGVCLCVCV